MRHVSTPESRRKGRASAYVVGRKQRAIEDATRAITGRVLASKLAPLAATIGGTLAMGIAVNLIERVNL